MVKITCSCGNTSERIAKDCTSKPCDYFKKYVEVVYDREHYKIPYSEIISWYHYMKELSIFEKDGGNKLINFTDKFSKYKINKNLKPIPKVGETYTCFDDGKISVNRAYTVDVSEIIPFDDIDDETKKDWLTQVTECNWLFSTTTDFFIKTVNGECGGDTTFVRTLDGGWFSIGNFMHSGRLDIDGELTKLLNKY